MTTVEEKVNELIRLMLGTTEEERNSARAKLAKMMDKPSVKDAEGIIHDMLLDLGSPNHLIGYDYVVQAIILAANDRHYINNITFGLYPELALKFESTASKVERAMRHLIEVTWTRGDLDGLNKYFGNTVRCEKGKPTNGEFIARMALLLQQRMKN